MRSLKLSVFPKPLNCASRSWQPEAGLPSCVHGKSVSLHLENLWSKNISITTRLVDTVTTPMLMKTVQSGKLNSKQLITHRFKLFEMIEAYDCFAHAAKEKTLKVLLSSDQ